MKNGFALVSLVLAIGLPNVVRAADDGDLVAIRACLKNWGKHPFQGENPAFRKISAKVKVFGIGKNAEDLKATDKPELVLVKPSVAVMSKTTIKLMNPNGWYCVKGRVSVLGKSALEAHCKAHLASSSDGATVLGSNNGEEGATTVLGSSDIKRVGCEKSE